MNQFIIAFRECLEAALIVGIIYTFLSKANLTAQIKRMWLAVVAAVVASIGVAYSLESINASIENESIAKLAESVFMYITAAVLLYVVFWLSKSMASKDAIEKLTASATESSSKWSIFFLVFFAILREGFETVMFLFGSSLQAGFSYVGFFSGIGLATLIGYLIVVQGKKINLKPFFSITSLFLVLFAAGMVAYGTHEMEEFVVKGNHLEVFGLESKTEITRPWNILVPQAELAEGATELFYNFNEQKGKYIHILHDKGTVGSFLKGFFGYNSNPNWIELFVWMLTLGFGLNIWRRFYKAA
ncbi:MAG: FTR1 family protein [Flavobacteriales bacterium]|jgi:high-affinity iron transporter|tara:strand:- start:1818 stop:2720 length:903 start_codon:yes stop_codon:yes gene_type:complete